MFITVVFVLVIMDDVTTHELFCLTFQAFLAAKAMEDVPRMYYRYGVIFIGTNSLISLIILAELFWLYTEFYIF